MVSLNYIIIIFSALLMEWITEKLERTPSENGLEKNTQKNDTLETQGEKM